MRELIIWLVGTGSWWGLQTFRLEGAAAKFSGTIREGPRLLWSRKKSWYPGRDVPSGHHLLGIMSWYLLWATLESLWGRACLEQWEGN